MGLLGLLGSRAQAEAPLRALPLVFHVAEENGVPVADDAFLQTQLERANEIYRPLGLRLVMVGKQKLASKHARLRTRDDRDALGTKVMRGVINCFVVAQLMDVDEEGRERRGVHWRVRATRQKHFVVVSAISSAFVLSHELGHFLGNQAHSDVPGNLMSYQQTDQLPVLDDAQQRLVLQTLSAMFARKELGAISNSQ